MTARVWLHAASLGDVNALSGLTRLLVSRGDHLTCSATTKAGQAQWRHLFPQLDQRAPPLLSKRSARRALEETGAEVLITELLEVWPAWVSTWSQAGVKIVVVDGRISSRTTWARALLFAYFRRIDLFCAQTERDALLALHMGVPPSRIFTCGDAKLDSLLARSSPPRSDVELTPLIVGCVRPRDVRPLLGALKLCPQVFNFTPILIAPRELKLVPKLTRLLKSAGLRVILDSQGERSGEQEQRGEIRSPSSVIILDRFGQLAARYYSSRVAIIGGTFYDRGQNLIEAALGGCEVIFGPRTDQIRAQSEALIGSGGHQVETWREALELAAQLLADPPPEPRRAGQAILSVSGALSKQIDTLDRLIFEPCLGQDRERSELSTRLTP